jgi:hypothetical protein
MGLVSSTALVGILYDQLPSSCLRRGHVFHFLSYGLLQIIYKFKIVSQIEEWIEKATNFVISFPETKIYMCKMYLKLKLFHITLQCYNNSNKNSVFS